MLYLVFLSKMIKKKPIFKLTTLESFIVYSFHWQTHQFQVLIPSFRAFCLSTRSSSVESTVCHSFSVSWVLSKPSLQMSNLTKPVLVVWGLGCKNWRRSTARSKNWGNKRPTIIKKSMTFFTIRAYHLYPKLFKRSWLVVTTTILWPAILASRKLANS